MFGPSFRFLRYFIDCIKKPSLVSTGVFYPIFSDVETYQKTLVDALDQPRFICFQQNLLETYLAHVQMIVKVIIVSISSIKNPFPKKSYFTSDEVFLTKYLFKKMLLVFLAGCSCCKIFVHKIKSSYFSNDIIMSCSYTVVHIVLLYPVLVPVHVCWYIRECCL